MHPEAYFGVGQMISGWFSKNLGDGMLASEPLARIEKLFLPEYVKAGSPEDIAVFIRHESEGRLHCEVKAYFSPAATVAAGAVDADPCARPSRDGLSLLAGVKESWLALFPERSD
jgi:hypothetical protein